MTPLVTVTKLIPPPPRPTLLPRPRLLTLIERRLADYRALLLAAPAGYGKSWLLSEVAATSQRLVCWYSLEPSDQEESCFLAHLLATLERHFPGIQADLPDSFTEQRFDLDIAVARLVNALHRYVHRPFLLILEDFHHVNASPVICTFVSQFIQKVDSHCSILISSRALPSLPDLPGLMVRHQVGQLTTQELAFRDDEVAALLRQNHRLALPEAEVQRLTRASEGWVTGLLLAPTSGLTQGGAPLRGVPALGVSLHTYFMQELLAPQAPWLRDCLLWTWLPGEFDAALCQEALGDAPHAASWQRFVEACQQLNLFVLPSEESPGRLRYHPLFRAFLQASLWQEQPHHAQRLVGQLAAFYERRGDWNQAYAYYEQGAPEELVAYLERAGSVLLRDGDIDTLKGWLDAVPGHLTQQPALLSLRGAVTVMEGNPRRGLLLLARAISLSREAGAPEVLARSLVRSAVAHGFVGAYQEALTDADEALALLEGASEPTLLHAEALRARGLSLSHLGQSRSAQAWLERALTAYDLLQAGQNVAILHMDLGAVQFALGRYYEALHHQNAALAHWRQVGHLAWQANVLNNLGVLYHAQGDYLRANEQLEASLTCAMQSGYARLEAFAWCSLGDLYTDLEAYQAAAHAYARARQGAGLVSEQFLLLALHLSHARWLRRQGMFALAHHTLAIARSLAESDGSFLERGLYHREAGLVALAEHQTTGTIGSRHQAQHHLEQALACLVKGDQQAEIPGVYLWLASVYQLIGQSAEAKAALTLALTLGGELESPHLLGSAAREVKPFLQEARNWPMLGTSVALLLRQVEAWEQKLPAIRRELRPQVVSTPFLPPHLTLHALGGEQAWVDGEPIGHATWRFLKARDLLFCLLAHPQGLTKEQIGLLFWPDSSPSQLKYNFKVIIHRLRRVLGQEVIMLEDGIYRFNRALDYESDVEQFDSYLAQARAATQPTEQLSAYRRAMAYYQGDYLPEMEEDWVLLERERLRLAYLDGLWRLAKVARALGNEEEAHTACQRLLTEDPCHEAAHRFLMRLYAANGQRAAVVRQFARCQQSLRDELALPPSNQTTSLFSRLVHLFP